MSQFGEDFGQKVDLTASIRNILRNYPEGTAIFKELIQNADDAGAHVVRFCLDMRTHHSERLAHSSLAAFQGPALLVFNDATFTEEDFQSIQRIGDSLKNQNETSKTKIGRFGIGFNAVYHWTELPSFVSDRFLVMLDPQARFLPNVNPANPGKIVDWIKNKHLLEELRDQFEPYSIPELDWKKAFAGTLFRLPLRTVEQASSSFLSKRALNPQEVLGILYTLVEETSRMLLFLRNVEKIEITVWQEGQSRPESLHCSKIRNIDATLRIKRSFDDVLGKNRQRAIASSSIATRDFSLVIDVVNERDGGSRFTESWELSTQFGGGNASRLAADPSYSHLKFVPLGGVAVMVNRLDAAGNASGNKVKGAAYCFLPLPIDTGLPIMVNGFFELSSNRRDIWQESVDMTGDGSTRANWNMALLKDVLAPSYLRILFRIRDLQGFSHFYQQLWPKHGLAYPWSQLAQATIQLAANEKALLIDGMSTWIEPSKAIVIPLALSVQDEKEELSRILRHLKTPIVTFAVEDLRETLIHSKVANVLATPVLLRNLLRLSNDNKQQRIKLEPSMCKFALSYCLSDQPRPYPDLDNLPILPLRNQEIGALRVFSEDQKAAIEALLAMGFSLQDSLNALYECNFNIEQSLERLANGPTNQSRRKEGLYILVSAGDDLQIFQAANCMLVDNTLLGAKEVEILSKPSFISLANIRKFEASLVPDLLSHILPPACFEKKVVARASLSEIELRHLSDFLPLFWQYVQGHPKTLSYLCEGMALLPTTDMAELCPISRLSNIVCPVRGEMSLPKEVLSMLRTLQVRVLDLDKMLCEVGLLPTAFWDYVHPPTFKGVLAALHFASRGSSNSSTNSQFVNLTSSWSASERNALRHFLVSHLPSEITEEERSVLRLLPIFRLMNSPNQSESQYTSLAAGDASIAFAVVKDSNSIPSTLFPYHILDVDSSNELDLLSMLKVSVLKKSWFYRNFLLPHAEKLYQDHRTEMEMALFAMFTSLRVFIEEDKGFADYLRKTPSLPNGAGNIKLIGELYDPTVPEIFALMGDVLLPHEVFRVEDVIAILRQLGLCVTIELPSVLACARAIAAMPEEGDLVEEKRKKANSLLSYLNRNMAKLTGEEMPVRPPQTESKGGFGLFSSITSFFSDKTIANSSGGQKKSEIQSFAKELQLIAWLPILAKPPVPFIPWRKPISNEKCIAYAKPVETVCFKDAWYCSASCFIADGEVSSSPLITALGWSQPIAIEKLTVQLRAIIHSYQQLASCKTDSEESLLENNSEVLTFRQTLSEILPSFYQRFDEELATSNGIMSSLEDLPWIWTGTRFVFVTKVAKKSAVNAEPYLYQLPEMIRPFGRLLHSFQLKETFGARDYVEALLEMAIQSGATRSNQESSTDTEGPDKRKASMPLEESRLDLAISLVVMVASESSSVLHAQTIYVPDVNGELAPAIDLVNDDVPWLAGEELIHIRSGCRMVHPKISSAVAEKIGVRSLRLSLVNQSLQQDLFSLSNITNSQVGDTGGAIQSFGQAESLTNRLKTILDLYPDGSPILNELIQNADDAGATIVRIMIDENHYPSNSLMDSRMKVLQTPALVVQNNSTFSEADFRNLASVGQGSKLQKLSTTGRFGLGFNSTYHLTDTPCFVSGDYMVFFDPHCAYVPGATLNQPGMRIRFTGNNLHNVFANQFQPFQFYGLDFSQPYAGTMFRFPLRSISQAKRSEICKRSYMLDDLYSVIDHLLHQLNNVLLFLRSVKRIEIYKCCEGSSEPILLHATCAEVSKKVLVNDHSLLNYFSAGQEDHSKDTFYAKLASTSDQKLPWTAYTKVIVTESYSARPSSSVEGETQEGLTVAKNAKHSDESDWSPSRTTICVFETVAGLSGGSAKRIACQEDARHLKLVPFGCVAACFSRTIVDSSGDGQGVEELLPPLNGQLFCFLPLPITTSMPVHINAYWELSSNRRDIWRGEDTKGEAKLRSDWNIALMKDVLSPLYARLLSRVNLTLMDRTDEAMRRRILSLLPCPLPPQPWRLIAEALFPLINSSPLLWSKLAGGQFVTPASSYLLEESSATVSINNALDWLEDLLLEEELPVVTIQSKLIECFQGNGCSSSVINPQWIRGYFQRKSGKVHASLAGTNKLVRAAKLLKYAMTDVMEDPSKLGLLYGVKLLPLSSGELAVIDSPLDGELYFLVNESEASLLGKCPNRLISRDAIVETDLQRWLEHPSLKGVCNVQKLEPIDLLKLISSILPRYWLSDEVFIVNRYVEQSISDEWIKTFWIYLLENKLLNLFANVFPMLPVLSSQYGNLVKTRPTVSILPVPNRLEDKPYFTQLVNSLASTSIFFLDHSMMNSFMHHESFVDLLRPAGVKGILMAIEKAKEIQIPLKWEQWSISDRQAIQEFVLDYILLSLAENETLPADAQTLLRSLPIWPRYGNEKEASCYSTLPAEEVVWLPPVDIPEHLLNKQFLKLRVESDRKALAKLNLSTCKVGHFFAEYVLTNDQSTGSSSIQQSYAQSDKNWMSQYILDHLSKLEADRPEIRTLLRDCAIFQRGGGNGSEQSQSSSIASLYDPDVPLLRSFLPATFFPSDQLCSNPMHLYAMKSLGLKKEVSCEDILQCARFIEERLYQRRTEYQQQSNHEDQSNMVLADLSEQATALLSYLASHIERLLLECDPEGLQRVKTMHSASNEETTNNSTDENQVVLGGNWSEQLRYLVWLPVLVAPPKQFAGTGLPWPGNVHTLPLATPEQATTPRFIWIASATMRICAVEVSNPLLLTVFGWDKPICGTVIALQLISLSQDYQHAPANKKPAFSLAISEVYPMLLSRLYDAYLNESATQRTWIRGLSDQAFLWMNDERFVEPRRVALQGIQNFNMEPYLNVLPAYMLKYKDLMLEIGVQQSFTSKDLVELMREYSKQYQDGNLPTNILAITIGLAGLLYRLFKQECEESGDSSLSASVTQLGTIFLPNRHGVLKPVDTLVYNDAPWILSSLSEQRLRAIPMAHDRLDINALQAFGAKSLRELLFGGEGMLCPTVEQIKLRINDQPIHEVINGLIHFVDELGGSCMDVFYDDCSYPTESLLQPGLSSLQGPALVVYVPGVSISQEGVTRATTVSLLPGEVSQGFHLASTLKLLSAFIFTDCLFILSGNDLCVIDPIGDHLMDSVSSPVNTSDAPRIDQIGGKMPKAKRYQINKQNTSSSATAANQSNSLLNSFADQFKPFLSLPNLHAGQAWNEKGFLQGIIVRMPLRQQTSAISSFIPNQDVIKKVFGHQKSCLTAAVIFSRTLSTIRLGHLGIAERGEATTPNGETLPQETDRIYLVDLEVALLSDLSVRSQRLKLLESTGWEKQTGLNKVITKFLSAYVPPTVSYLLRIKTSVRYDNAWPKFEQSLEKMINRFMSGTKPRTVSSATNSEMLQIEEAWMMSGIMGHSSQTDLALNTVYRPAGLQPYVCIAMQVLDSWHLSQHDLPPDSGFYVKNGALLGVTGFPFHIEGHFIAQNSPAGKVSSQAIGQKGMDRVAIWNNQVIITAIDQLYTTALLQSVKRLMSEPAATLPGGMTRLQILEGMYKYWIYLPRLSSIASQAVLSTTEWKTCLNQEPLYLNSTAGLKKVDHLLFQTNAFHPIFLSYLQDHLPLARCPAQILLDLQVMKIVASDLTPGRLRAYLKKDAGLHLDKLSAFIQSQGVVQGRTLVIELLRYATADLPSGVSDSMGEFLMRKAYRSLQGCPLLLMADHSIRFVPVNSQDHLAHVTNSKYFHLLPPAVLRQLLHPILSQTVPLFKSEIFLDTLYISSFNCSFIKSILSSILPITWKGLPAVQWPDNSSAAQNSTNGIAWDKLEQLLYLFWTEIFLEAPLESLLELREYPLVPVSRKGQRLLISPAFLPFTIVSSPSPQSELARDRLRNQVSLIEGEGTAAVEGNSLTSSSSVVDDLWMWTRSKVEDASFYAQNTSAQHSQVSTDQSRSEASAGGEQNGNQPMETSAVGVGPLSPPMEGILAEESLVETFDQDSSSASSRRQYTEMMLETYNVLTKAGFPFLDASFLEGLPRALSHSSSTYENLKDDVGKLIVEIAHHFISGHVMVAPAGRGDGRVMIGETVLIDLEALSVVERTHLLLEIYQNHRTSSFTDALVEKVKALPLFTNSADNTAVSLMECSSQGVFWCQDRSVLDVIISSRSSSTVSSNTTANPTSSTSSSLPVILINLPELLDVYRWLRISELTASLAMVNFVIPTIDSMDSQSRLKLLDELSRRWTLYRSDPLLLSSLRTKQLIPMWSVDNPEAWKELVQPATECSSQWRCIHQLLSWTNRELYNSLDGETLPRYYAPPALQQADYHVMFTDLGMSAKLSSETFLSIAQDIQSDGDHVKSHAGQQAERDGLLRKCLQRGRLILRYLLIDGGDRFTDLVNNDPTLLRRLSTLRFVPMNRPIQVEEGGFVHFEEDLGSYSQFVAKANGAAACLVSPVLEDDLTPPSIHSSRLQIITHPSQDVILRQLDLLISCKTLDRWNSRYTIKETFHAVYTFLSDRWSGLSTSKKIELQSSPCIPFDEVLVSPKRVFFRLNEDLSPFMYELPRYFAVHEKLLKEMNVRECPQAKDYIVFLQELASERSSCSLNVNELRAVLMIVQIILAEMDPLTQSTATPTSPSLSSTANRWAALSSTDRSRIQTLKQSIFVPDEHSRLVPLTKIVINDDANLVNKVQHGVQHFHYSILHPALNGLIAGSGLLVWKLSEVVVEDVDERLTSDATILLTEHEATPLRSRVSTWLSNPSVIKLLEQLRTEHIRVSRPSVIPGPGGNEGSSLSSYDGDVIVTSDEKAFFSLEQVLTSNSLQILFTARLVTMCLLKDPLTGKVMEVLQRSVHDHELPIFLKKPTSPSSPSRLYLNIAELRSGRLTLELLVALGLCRYLSLPKHMAFAISQGLVEPTVGDGHSPLNYMELFLEGDSDVSRILIHSRGQPGRELIAVDYELVELRPFRHFRVGEVVAVDESEKPSSLPPPLAATAGSQSSEKKKKLLVYGKIVKVGEANEVGLRKLDIRTKALVRLMSTEVYSFRSGAKDPRPSHRDGAGNSLTGLPIPPPSRSSKEVMPFPAPTATATSASSSSLSAINTVNATAGSVAEEQSEVVDQKDVLQAMQVLLRRAGLPLTLDQQSLMARVLELETANKRSEESLSLERQQANQAQQRVRDKLQHFLCSICLEKNIQRALVPCGHSFCDDCCAQLPRNRCPICRNNIQAKLKLFVGDQQSDTETV